MDGEGDGKIRWGEHFKQREQSAGMARTLCTHNFRNLKNSAYVHHPDHSRCVSALARQPPIVSRASFSGHPWVIDNHSCVEHPPRNAKAHQTQILGAKVS